MNIAPVRSNFFNRHNINFTSKVIEVGSGIVPKECMDAVDYFEESDRSNAKRLGDGLSAVAYLIKGTNWVLKESRHDAKSMTANGDFSQEAESLELIPETLKNNAQQLIGNVKTEAGYWYLLSTLVDGQVADGKNVKWERESFRSLMSGLAELDAANIFHGDVSKNNCLVTKDKEVNFIDFQYARKFDFKGEEVHKQNAEIYKVPYFIAPSNLQMFEESNFGTYLVELEDEAEAKKVFQEFLEEKSLYHKKRAKAFKEQGARPEIVEYDTLMAKYLKNPPKGLKDLSAQKLQVMMEHRGLLSAFDGFDNIMSIVPLYLNTIETSNKMAESAKQYAEQEKDPQLKKLYEYFEKDAEFWRSSMKNEVQGRYGHSSAFGWILRNAKKQPYDYRDDASAHFRKAVKNKMPHLVVPNVADMLMADQKEIKFQDTVVDVHSAEIDGVMNVLRKMSAFYVNKNSPALELIEGHHKAKEEILEELRTAHKVYSEGRQNDSLFYTMRAMYLTANLSENARMLANNPVLNREYEKPKMEEEANKLSDFVSELSKVNENLFNKLYDQSSGKPIGLYV